MILKNGTIFTEEGFQEGSIGVADGKFLNGNVEDGEVLDVTGKYVLPGLIDVHGHGNSGYDFSTCDENGLRIMAAYLAENGITSFAPASMTVSYESLKKAYGNALALHKNRKEKEAKVVGINMEGPFFSYGKRGAQNPEYLKLPDFEVFVAVPNAGLSVKDVMLARALQRDHDRHEQRRKEQDGQSARKDVKGSLNQLVHGSFLLTAPASVRAAAESLPIF